MHLGSQEIHIHVIQWTSMGVGHPALLKMEDYATWSCYERKNILARNVRQVATLSHYQGPLLITSLYLCTQFAKGSSRWNRGTVTKNPKQTKNRESNSSNVKCSRHVVHQLQAQNSTALINKVAFKVWKPFSRHISNDNGICYLDWKTKKKTKH